MRKIKIERDYKIKDGKLVRVHRFRDASHAAAAKKSQKKKWGRRLP